MKISRLLLAASFIAACSPVAACSAPAPQGPDGVMDEAAQQEAELSSDEESFDDYDASDDELAKALPEAPLENEMTLYAIPAPKLFGLKWRRPGGLARRTLLNVGLGFSRALGHAAIHLDCGGEKFTGSVYDTGTEFKTMVMDEKAGLGVLLRTVPGTLETAEELQPTLDERYGNGRVTFIRFQLSPDTCTALLDYAKEFKAKNIAKEYGFVRPLYREGAGCSAFSMAFLELANLDEARFRSAWSFDVRIPMKLIGGKDNPGNKVSVFELFTTFGPWASETEPHERLAGWDPTLMFTSIRSWTKDALKAGQPVEKRGKAIGLVLDRRSVTPRAELSNRTYWAGSPGAPRDWWGYGDP